MTLRFTPRRPLAPQIWAALMLAAPVRIWAIILAGPPLTVFASWLVGVIVDRTIPPLSDHQLTIVGWALHGVILLLGVIIVALAAVRVHVRGPGGAGLELGGEASPEEAAP